MTDTAAPTPAEETAKPRKIMPRHRRQALKHARNIGLDPVDGEAAVKELQARGIDIFSLKDSILDIAKAGPGDGAANLVLQDSPMPVVEARPQAALSVAEREIEIDRIRSDLVKRRRRRLALLVMRLLFFVALPTALVGHYYYNIATPMYETDSAFVVRVNESSAAGSGSLFAGMGFATSQDSIVVQDYLLSKEAFSRLNSDLDYATKFQDPVIDDIQRLAADASADDAYKLFKKNVTIGYDPTEGLIRMSVVAPTPEASEAFSQALVGYAEERVDGLSIEARGDQLENTEERYRQAEQDMLDAQNRVLELQQNRGVLSADAEIAAQMTLITGLDSEIETKQLALAELLENPRPNATRVEGLEREIARMRNRAGELRSAMVASESNTISLARISAELQVAQTELATRQMLLTQALTAVEVAQAEASKQTRYLSMGVSPVAPQDAAFPRKFEGTALAFLIFTGIYVVLSLTISVLREQVSV